jgi:uncharacterized membrane protein YkoI
MIEKNRAVTQDEDMTRNRLLPWFVLCACVILALPALVRADDVDRVRELRSTDSILPLSQILQVVEKRYPGTLLEVELEEEKGTVIYEMELLGKDNVVHQLKIDAKTGKILSVDKKD